jgi:hypothetical protein
VRSWVLWGHVDGSVDRANIALRSRRVLVAALVETSVGLVLRGEDRPNEGSGNKGVLHLECNNKSGSN